MSGCPVGDYNGKCGQPRDIKTIQIAADDISDVAIATGKCIHDGTLIVTCAAQPDGDETGVIEELILKLLNGTTTAVLPEVTAYVFNEDLATPPISGGDIAMTADEYAALKARIDVPVATAIPDTNGYRSVAEGVSLERGYKCTGDNNSLYIVLLNKGSSITFASTATMELDVQNRHD